MTVDATTPHRSASGAGVLPPLRAARGRPQLLAGAAAAVLALAYLMYTALESGAVYYLTVAELEAKGAAAYEERVRVAGKVLPGSIEREGSTVRFTVVEDPALGEVSRPSLLAWLLPIRTSAGVAGASLSGASGPRPLRVTYAGVVPDIFGDGTDVVVEGRLSPAGVFDASTLLAKCPSRFEEAVRAGHAAPRTDGA